MATRTADISQAFNPRRYGHAQWCRADRGQSHRRHRSGSETFSGRRGSGFGQISRTGWKDQERADTAARGRKLPRNYSLKEAALKAKQKQEVEVRDDYPLRWPDGYPRTLIDNRQNNGTWKKSFSEYR